MFSIIIVLFLLYFPAPQITTRHDDEHHEYHDDHPHHIIPRPSEILHSEYSPPTYRTAVSVTVASAVYFMLGAVINIIFLSRNNHHARIWAAWLGVISMILAAAQYIPQLWVTWRIKVLPPSPLSTSASPFPASPTICFLLGFC